MASLLVRNIGELITWSEDQGDALVIDDGRVAWIGASAAAPATDTEIDANGGCVLPGFVDSHTHLVFGGDRVAEFEARLRGEKYAAGGIRTTVAATRDASEDQLLTAAWLRASEALFSGTTTLEIKSGYGLDVETEERMLRVARRLTPHTTFLGAHVAPDPATVADYVEAVSGEMLDACAPVSSGVDAFCESDAFDADQCREVLSAGKARGLEVHVHANQLGHGPGVQLAAELAAASADHCTHLSESDVDALRDADVTAVLVPAAEFSTRSPYAPARRLLDAGVQIALATDCNPGTSYTTSMPFVIALACRELGLSVHEAIRAATLGGAAALRQTDIGHLGIGARGDLVILNAPSAAYLAYRPGVKLVSQVVRRGEANGGWMLEQ